VNCAQGLVQREKLAVVSGTSDQKIESLGRKLKRNGQIQWLFNFPRIVSGRIFSGEER
jgi:hypothetical protein